LHPHGQQQTQFIFNSLHVSSLLEAIAAVIGSWFPLTEPLLLGLLCHLLQMRFGAVNREPAADDLFTKGHLTIGIVDALDDLRVTSRNLAAAYLVLNLCGQF